MGCYRYELDEGDLFLSADPFVQAPYNTQSYNRYSYVFNNPLSFTDPSGYQTCESTGGATGALGQFQHKPAPQKCEVKKEEENPVEDVKVTGTREEQERQSMQDGGNNYSRDQQNRDFLQSIINDVGIPLGDGYFKVSTAQGEDYKVKIDDGFDSQKAFDHYRAGSGETKRIGFSQVDTSKVAVKHFKKVKDALATKQPGTTAIDEKLQYTTSGDNFFMLGNITLRLQGNLEINKKDWSFNGTLKSYDDTYDFNRSTHRKFFGELLTTFGRNTEGKSFDIEIRGERPITESGGF